MYDENASKTTTIRRTAVRETAVSRHYGRPIEGPHEASQTSQHYGIEGFKGAKLYRESDVSQTTDVNLPDLDTCIYVCTYVICIYLWLCIYLYLYTHVEPAAGGWHVSPITATDDYARVFVQS